MKLSKLSKSRQACFVNIAWSCWNMCICSRQSAESNDSPDYVQATWPKAKMESSNTRGIERPPAIPGPYKTEVMGHTTVRTPKTKKIIGGKPRQMKKEKPQELQPLTQIVPTIAKKYVRKLKICRKGLQPTASVSSGESSPEYFVKKNNSATGTRKFMRRVRYIIDKEFSNMPGTTYRCPKMHLQGHKFVGRHRTKIWLCLVCQKEERDEKGDVMVCCEKCEDWYHLRCVGVANEKVPKYINWYCKRCIVRHCREGDFDKSAFPLYQKPGSKLKAALKLKVWKTSLTTISFLYYLAFIFIFYISSQVPVLSILWFDKLYLDKSILIANDGTSFIPVTIASTYVCI